MHFSLTRCKPMAINWQIETGILWDNTVWILANFILNDIVYFLFHRYRRLSGAALSEQWNMPRPRQRLPMWLWARLQWDHLWKQCVLAILVWLSNAIQIMSLKPVLLSHFLLTCRSVTFETSFEDIKDCHGQPCQNNGTCVDLVNEYRCDCAAGFNGTYCENSV